MTGSNLDGNMILIGIITVNIVYQPQVNLMVDVKYEIQMMFRSIFLTLYHSYHEKLRKSIMLVSVTT